MSGLALSFAAPSWLWLLVALPILWFWPRRLEDMRLGLLRSLALTLIVLGLARPSLPGEGATPHHVLLLDASRSAAAAASRVAAGAESMGAALGEASTTRIILSEATAAAAGMGMRLAEVGATAGVTARAPLAALGDWTRASR